MTGCSSPPFFVSDLGLISQQIPTDCTENNVYQFLLDFDTLYERMTDLEKKQFMRTFIESIELYLEKKDNGRIISKIELRFPVYHDGQEGNEIRMPDKNTVETVCALSKLSEAKHHVSVQVDMDELDLTAAESKATYEEIQAWVQERYGRLFLKTAWT